MSRRWSLSWCTKVTKDLYFFFSLSLFLWSEKVQIAWSYKYWGSSVLLCSLLQMGLVPESVCSSLNKAWKDIVKPKQCPGLRHVPISPLLCAMGCLMLSKPWPECQTPRPTKSPQVLTYVSSKDSDCNLSVSCDENVTTLQSHIFSYRNSTLKICENYTLGK